MKLDEQTKAILDRIQASGAPPMYTLSVADARAGLRSVTRLMDIPETEVHKREDSGIPGPNGDIPVRIYWPRPVDEGELLPILMLYHGGAWVLGDLDTHENMARYYCRHADVIVINVDYRLAPEHKFPAAVEDSYAALCWAADHARDIGGDPNRIGVTGDSAGGNISAVLCQLAKAEGGPHILYQALVYPSVNIDMDADYESRKKFGGGEYFLCLKGMERWRGLYLGGREDHKKDQRASPILAEALNGLPPALVITAGFDPLHDEGKQYADRLMEAGVPVVYHCFENTIHGFMSFGGAIDAGRDGLDKVALCVREALHR